MIEIKEKKLQGYTFIDLFAGLGGFRLFDLGLLTKVDKEREFIVLKESL